MEEKSNQENTNDQEHNAHEQKRNVRNISRYLKGLLGEVWVFLKDILNITDDTDYENTVKGIHRDIEFKGHNVWILICSIFIASIGLNLNSAAVIIGAMLIAPLMGPILGVGLAIGTNDLPVLIKSLKNFAVMVAISLITAWLYFLFTPLVEEQPELLARTKPTTLDILIAVFGGFAGIVAGSRKEKSNVVPGVAIATALMPPLCTAGFGLATLNFSYFFGAFYLFMLNSIFICISTVVVVRYLKFPLKQFVNPAREKKVKRYIIIFVLIVILPSGIIFWDVLKESWFHTRAENFITKEIEYPGSKVVNRNLNYGDSLSIDLFLIGEIVPETEIKRWKGRMLEYGIGDAELHVYQSKDASDDIAGKLKHAVRSDIIEDIYKRNEEILENKEQKIAFLEEKLLYYKKGEIPFEKVIRELRLNNPEIKDIGFSLALMANAENEIDTVPTFMFTWDANVPKRKVRENEERLEQLLKIRLDFEQVNILDVTKR